MIDDRVLAVSLAMRVLAATIILALAAGLKGERAESVPVTGVVGVLDASLNEEERRQAEAYLARAIGASRSMFPLDWLTKR